MEPHFRQDSVTGRWVIIAAERFERPQDLKVVFERSHARCPFCEGDEHETTPELMALREPGSAPNGPGWRLRVIPNKYPTVTPDASEALSEHRLYRRAGSHGVHEVIIESPRHVTYFSQLESREVVESLVAYAARLRAAAADGRWKYALVFKNVGATAGASLEHTHSQLVATAIVPDVVAQELAGAEAYYAAHRQCVFCALSASELAGGERLVAETERFVALCPYASRFGYETWVLPKAHAERFEEVTRPDCEELGSLLRHVLVAIERVVDPPAYNLVIHTLPFDRNGSPHYHWHVEILPSMTRVAGFEWGAGIHINPIAPEEAAARLRG